MVENEEGEPWSYSPETRASYEVALGRFILAFNDVDDLVTKLIRLVLWKLGRDDLFGRCVEKDFAHKLFVLDLLKSSHRRGWRRRCARRASEDARGGAKPARARVL